MIFLLLDLFQLVIHSYLEVHSLVTLITNLIRMNIG